MKRRTTSPRAYGLAPLVVILVSALASDAEAQVDWTVGRNDAHRDHHLDIMGASNAGSTLGLAPGILYGFPVLPQGFLPTVNDVFEIELGAYAHLWFADPTYVWVTPVGGVRWDFWLTRSVDVYVTVKLGWAIGLTTGFSGGLYGIGGLGMDWRFSDRLAIRVEADGARGGGVMQVGLSFRL